VSIKKIPALMTPEDALRRRPFVSILDDPGGSRSISPEPDFSLNFLIIEPGKIQPVLIFFKFREFFIDIRLFGDRDIFNVLFGSAKRIRGYTEHVKVPEDPAP
jgi:hypothetical protein